MKKTITLPKVLIFLLLLSLVGIFFYENSISQENGEEITVSPKSSSHSASSSSSPRVSKRTQEHLCTTCGERHHPSVNHFSTDSELPSVLPSAVQHWMSRDPENITTTTLANGTEVISLNGTFGHMSAARIHSDGTITVNCSTSAEELSGNPSLTKEYLK